MEKQPKILFEIYNVLLDIRKILVKVHKAEICPHRTLSKEIEYWTASNEGNFTVHRCLTCDQLRSVPEKGYRKKPRGG